MTNNSGSIRPAVLIADIGHHTLPTSMSRHGELWAVDQATVYPAYNDSISNGCILGYGLDKMYAGPTDKELRDVASKEENRRQQKALKLQAKGKKFKRFL